MHPTSRTRRILKWTGVGLSILIVATGVASLWCSLNYILNPNLGVWIDAGRTGVMIPDRFFGPLELRYIFDTRLNTHPFEHEGFHLRVWNYDSYGWGSGHLDRYSVSIWLFAIAVALPTAWLWHRDRRRIRPDCCLRCGYDLTGNTIGRCPECGTIVPTFRPTTAAHQETVRTPPQHPVS